MEKLMRVFYVLLAVFVFALVQHEASNYMHKINKRRMLRNWNAQIDTADEKARKG